MKLFRKYRVKRLKKERDQCVVSEVFWQKKCREQPENTRYKQQLRKSIKRYRQLQEQIENLKG